MPVLVIVYVTFSIFILGAVLSRYPFRALHLSAFEEYLLGFAVLSYVAILFMVLKWFPLFTAFLHGTTLLSTLVMIFGSDSNVLFKFRSDPGRLPGQLPVILVIIGLAFCFRLPVSNFIFDIGDAGAYINSANHLARDGIKATQFFPLTQAWFAIFNALAGRAHTPWATPFFSVSAVLTTYFLMLRLFKSVRTALIGMLLLAVNILAIWFGRLPYSESLMAFLNTTLLYLFISFAFAGATSVKSYILLIPLYVGLASLTRVTGIVWMAAISMNLFLQRLMNSERSREYFILFIGSMLLYSLSVAYGLTFARHYYIGWQLKDYLPFLSSPAIIVVFHCLWLAAGIGVFLTVHRFPETQRRRIQKALSNKPALYSAACFLGLLLIGNLLVTRDFQQLFPVTFVIDLFSLRLPQDAYYLYNFFGIVSWICLPVGLFFVFRHYNPIESPELITPWFFGLGFLVIYYSRIVHHYAHSVYLYYLRYFISEILIIFLVVLCAAVNYGLKSGKWLKSLSILFIMGYCVQSAYWISQNSNHRYLENAYDLLSDIEAVVPRSDAVLFTDVHYDGKWVYPNFDACFLSPLEHSFGYQVRLTKEPPDPYLAPYSKRKLNRVVSNPENLKTAYVLVISKDGDRPPPDFSNMPGIEVSHVDTIKSYIRVKSHDPGHIFLPRHERQDIMVDIWKLKRFYLIPYLDRFIRQSGFFHRSMWTDGSGRFDGFDYAVQPGDQYLVLATYGYNPLRDDPEKLQLQVEVNGVPVDLSHIKNNIYYFHLPADQPHLTSVEIRSSIFVPIDFGINKSRKKLGMDIRYITIG